ncbi:MFS transporter [Ferdinandcohnia quinoae]|uniref:MFS transporter n=1 Tax=Fredinandcohnia quinoae TaxID=2918902 RepID=A0AAW5DU23_9BACI|nr:MFS transporter [Fredinandcohnia sp. SECRCQ15]MCH1624122.1 MFS transporter [Fredinandcohnia sp. SECRCQ15]
MQNQISRKDWTLIWVLGMAGQICWNIENSWFNTFVYDKIAKDPSIISWMVGITAIVSTLTTFIIGTWSDRIGRRKPFIAIGFICWGIFTIAFGATEFLPKDPLIVAIVFIVAADAVMSFFGSTGYDAGYNPWTTDISNPSNRGKLGGAFAAMPVLATIFGAVVSGIIVDRFDFFPFFIVMGTIVSLVGVLTLFTLNDHPNLKARKNKHGYWHQFAEVFNIKTVLENKELFWVFIINCVYFIGFNVYFPYITIYLNNYLNMSYSVSGALQGIGLVAAIFLTIPVAKSINKGKTTPIILFAVIANIIGLLLIATSSNLVILLIGIFGAGVGYVLMIQTITAWVKNLFPEQQRGQFEGVKMVFAVCLPMVIGPLISNIVINRYGIHMVIDGVSGMVPNESLFLVSAVITLFTLLPLIPANKYTKARITH